MDRSPERRLLRCASCGALLRARIAPSDGAARAYDVEVVGHAEQRLRVELPWGEEQERALRRWLAWASSLTLGLVGLLYLLVRLLG